MSNPTALVQKLWNYCSILRDDGLSYGDYVNQSQPLINKLSKIKTGVKWRLSVMEEIQTLMSSNRPRATRRHQKNVQKAFAGEMI